MKILARSLNHFGSEKMDNSSMGQSFALQPKLNLLNNLSTHFKMKNSSTRILEFQ